MTRKNPFTINPIRKKEEFIGRENLISDIKNSLSRQECCHILGERKSGKTSFLYRMAEEFKEEGNMLFVFLDMQQLIPYNAEEILGRIAHCIDENKTGERMKYKEFEDFIRDKKVIIALDEISAILKNEKIKDEFFIFLRGISSNFDVVFLTTHREGLYEIANEVSSPFFNYFRNFDLGYFTEEESKELIQKGGEEFFNNYGEWIIEKAYYHPFLLQLICLILFGYYKENKEDKESIFFKTEEEAYRTLEGHFKYWHKKSSEEEKKILKKIIFHKGCISNEEEITAQHLEKRLLIYKKSDRYHLISPFFEKTVKLKNKKGMKIKKTLMHLSHLVTLLIEKIEKSLLFRIVLIIAAILGIIVTILNLIGTI